jgi:hypothetical protein
MPSLGSSAVQGETSCRCRMATGQCLHSTRGFSNAVCKQLFEVKPPEDRLQQGDRRRCLLLVAKN